MNVKLISYTKDPEKTVVAAIRQCYSQLTGSDLWQKAGDPEKKKLIKQVISSGHTSTIEHASFTFAIDGVSRALTHQLVRHRIASYSQKSQRYVKEGNFEYILPSSIKKNPDLKKKYDALMKQINFAYIEMLGQNIPAEDARMVLPNACETKIIVTMNARSLFNFFQERMCNRAQWEIRAMASEMYREVMKVAPNIFKYAGPTCVTEKICWQGKLNCGKPSKINGIELRERF